MRFHRCALVFGAVVMAVVVSAPRDGWTAPERKSITKRPATVKCAHRRNVLGVSRVVKIDTSNGPQFGLMQYKMIDFLKDGEVVLTFDDGPLRRKSLAVLNALEAECTKATFFMVGRMAVTDPLMVQEIAKRGHTVGTHTWSHKNVGRLSRSRAKLEIELGISAISAALGRPVTPFFRFPYLGDSRASIAYLKSRNIGIFSIDVDSLDFRTRSGGRMVDRVMSTLKRKGKGILLFHDIQKSTARGIVDLLRRLRRGGYKVVHLVSDTKVGTLKKYDALAQREVARRAKAVARRPLAARSVVWPITSGGLPTPEDLTYSAPRPETDRYRDFEDADDDSAVLDQGIYKQPRRTQRRRRARTARKRQPGYTPAKKQPSVPNSLNELMWGKF